MHSHLFSYPRTTPLGVRAGVDHGSSFFSPRGRGGWFPVGRAVDSWPHRGTPWAEADRHDRKALRVYSILLPSSWRYRQRLLATNPRLFNPKRPQMLGSGNQGKMNMVLVPSATSADHIDRGLQRGSRFSISSKHRGSVPSRRYEDGLVPMFGDAFLGGGPAWRHTRIFSVYTKLPTPSSRPPSSSRHENKPRKFPEAPMEATPQ